MKRKFLIVFFVILLLNSFIYVVNASEINFSDVSNNHWARTSIENLNNRGTISGYKDGTFKPDKLITRAEATKILMTMFRNSIVCDHAIVDAANDVPKSHWANIYVLSGKQYILPDENENFRPDETITRGDFAFALNKILDYHLPSDFMITKRFSDIDYADKNYYAIFRLANNGLINGFEDNTFRPNDGLTRAQVCKLVDDAYNYLINKYTTEMKDASGWATYQIEDYGPGRIREDKEGNLMIYTGGKTTPTNLYYNGEFVASADPFLETVREETVTTSDNKKWKIKWFGHDVVETIENGIQYIIKDNYSGLDKTYYEEYIPCEEVLESLKYFTGMDYKIENEGENDYLVLDGHTHTNEIFSKKTINGKLYCNILCIETTVWSLYMNDYSWTGIDLETLENNRKNNEENNKTPLEVNLDIPDIPVESFASQAISDSVSIAYLGDVISVNMNTIESIYELKTRPVYYRLRKLYSGKEAEQIVENYNNRKNDLLSGSIYTRKIPDGNLYCILFDIDLRDFFNLKKESAFIDVAFMQAPQIAVFDLKNNKQSTILSSAIPNEAGKINYYLGDLTQMFAVFETPKDFEVSALYISFINMDDFSFETFFISNLT